MKRLWKSSDFQLTSWTRMFSLCCYVPEVMPPTLLCWSTMSEVAVGGMAVDVESSHQYSLTFCCCVTDGNRGAVWQNDVWHGSAGQAKVWCWIPPYGKDSTHWHSSMLAECFWRSNSECEHSEAVGGAFQQWWGWVTSTGADFYKYGMQALVHHWRKCIACYGHYAEK